MGKGKALRWRAKLAEAANWGNLHKAQASGVESCMALAAAGGAAGCPWPCMTASMTE